MAGHGGLFALKSLKKCLLISLTLLRRLLAVFATRLEGGVSAEEVDDGDRKVMRALLQAEAQREICRMRSKAIEMREKEGAREI